MCNYCYIFFYILKVLSLFFIGATMAKPLCYFFLVPNEEMYFVAALGFVSVFGAATNTPITSFVMGMISQVSVV